MSILISAPSTETGFYHALTRVPGVQVLFYGPLICARHCLMPVLEKMYTSVSFCCLTEAEVCSGAYEQKVIQAAEIVASSRNAAALTLIAFCQNSMIGTDFQRLCESVHEKTGLPADHLLVDRLQMYPKQTPKLFSPPQNLFAYDFILPSKEEKKPEAVNLIAPRPVPADSEIRKFLSLIGISKVLTVEDFKTFDDYRNSMSTSCLNIALTRSEEGICDILKERLGIPWMPLNARFAPEVLCEQYEALAEYLSPGHLDEARKFIQAAVSPINKYHAVDIPPVEVDCSSTDDAFGLLLWLIEKDVRISRVHFNVVLTPKDEALRLLARFDIKEPAVWHRYEPAPCRRSQVKAEHDVDFGRLLVGFEAMDSLISKIEEAREQ